MTLTTIKMINQKYPVKMTREEIQKEFLLDDYEFVRYFGLIEYQRTSSVIRKIKKIIDKEVR